MGHGPEENAGSEEASLSEDSPGVSDPELSDEEDLPENPVTAPAAPDEEERSRSTSHGGHDTGRSEA